MSDRAIILGLVAIFGFILLEILFLLTALFGFKTFFALILLLLAISLFFIAAVRK